MSKLLELIRHTEEQIDTYKHPDTDEFVARINPILKALGRGDLRSGDNIDNIVVAENYIRITTTYYAHGCECGADYEIPMDIIMDDDPVRAATIYTSLKAVREVNAHLASALAQHSTKEVPSIDTPEFLRKLFAWADAPAGSRSQDAYNEIVAHIDARLHQSKSTPASTKELYTCIGKGGDYELMGPAKPAGALKDLYEFGLMVYRDLDGQLYVRTKTDFDFRMEKQ